jgi:hypothetical protein
MMRVTVLASGQSIAFPQQIQGFHHALEEVKHQKCNSNLTSVTCWLHSSTNIVDAESGCRTPLPDEEIRYGRRDHFCEVPSRGFLSGPQNGQPVDGPSTDHLPQMRPRF